MITCWSTNLRTETPSDCGSIKIRHYLRKGCENPVIESNSTDGPLRFRRLIQRRRSRKLEIGDELIIRGLLTPDTTVAIGINHPSTLKF